MLTLLIALTPIALVDSLSVVPFSLVVLAVLLGGPKPYLSSTGFLAGTALSYFAAGLLIALGLGGLIETATEKFIHWFTNPSAVDYIGSMAIGVALIVLGYRWAKARQEKAQEKEIEAGMSPWQAFGLGAGATIAGLWGALPYFAAIDQILKADITALGAAVALAFYNLVFISLSAALVVLKAVLGDHADKLFDAMNSFIQVWGKRIMVTLLMVLGGVMIADGVGWLFGHPLIPVG